MSRGRGRLLGFTAVIGSAALFAIATVLVKFLTRDGISPMSIAFGRFALGACVMSAWFAVQKRRPGLKRPGLVIGRAVFNLTAVLLFYQAIHLTTVTKANMLNMTYPLFVAMLGPAVLGEATSRIQMIALVLGLGGIWLVIDPAWGSAQIGDLVGLACGMVSSIAVLFLRASRAYDAADVIVWFVMCFGSLLLLPAAPGILGLTLPQFAFWFGAAICGVVGQLLITFGYRWVSAVDGSIASSARIFFAGALGAVIFLDPVTPQLVGGAILILLGIYLIGRAEAAVT